MMQRLIDAANRFSGNVDVMVSAVPGAERITMNLVITNNSFSPVVLDYSSGQRYDFALLDSMKNVLYRWSADKLFIQALSSTTIGPGESLGYIDELTRINEIMTFLDGLCCELTESHEQYVWCYPKSNGL